MHAKAFNVEAMRFGVHSDKTRLVIETDSDVVFRSFVLPDPYRLVIDLPHFGWQAGNVPTNSKIGMRAIRYGALQPGISRIVLDMDDPILIKDAFTLPAQGAKPNRLVIDFTRVNVNSFEQGRPSVYGTLNENSVAPSLSPSSKQSIATKAAPPGATPQNKIDTSSPALRPKAKPAAVKSARQEKPLIVIDPGHGGVDPGAIGHGDRHEKTTVLNLSRELRNQLLSTGKYRVQMTRDKDVFIKLGERVKYGRRNDADLFISIHADSIDKPNVRGASVYTLSDKASDKQTAKLAARENRVDLIAGIDLSVEDKEVADILLDLSMRDTMNQSRFLAKTMVKSLKQSGVKTLQTPHRYAGFAVLKAPDVPSVLIEAGFMSNRNEAYMLNTPAYRAKMAQAIKNGVNQYFDHVNAQN